MSKKFLLVLMLLLLIEVSDAQSLDKIINEAEAERIEKVLSSDDMQGREVFKPGIDKAADFIADEFKNAGLKPWKGDSFFQEFLMQRSKFISAKGDLDGKAIDGKNIVAFSSQEILNINNGSGFEKKRITAADNLYTIVQQLMKEKKNYFVTVDTAHARMFNSLKRFNRESVPMETSTVFVLTNADPVSWSLEFKQEVTSLKLKNVVGIIPGKKRKDEYVIFSGHYDHLGIKKPDPKGDSIYNGANDDAAGTTAVIMLAKYFNEMKNNQRTLVFAAFTAEEVGGYGSQYFSKQLDPLKVMVMLNIEMIGTDSKWGSNSAYLTGYEKSDLGAILEKSLAGTSFKFYPDPYPQQQLFYRSDNATLARLGVPAHTISTSKMDSEKYYHTQDDEIEMLDIKNMTGIIKAIALSAKSIISGEDTPSRVIPASFAQTD